MMSPSSSGQWKLWPPSSWASTSTDGGWRPWRRVSGRWARPPRRRGGPGCAALASLAAAQRLLAPLASPLCRGHNPLLSCSRAPAPAAVRQLRGESGTGAGGEQGAGAPPDLSFSQEEPADVEAAYVSALEELSVRPAYFLFQGCPAALLPRQPRCCPEVPAADGEAPCGNGPRSLRAQAGCPRCMLQQCTPNRCLHLASSVRWETLIHPRTEPTTAALPQRRSGRRATPRVGGGARRACGRCRGGAGYRTG